MRSDNTANPQGPSSLQEDRPLSLHEEPVIADWVDYNGHMNVAYYVLVFDHATDALLDHLEIGERYRNDTGGSVFVVETHVTYLQEVMLDDRLKVTTRIIDSDEKRLHVFHTMYQNGADDVVATGEFMILHVDLATRRSSPFPAHAQEMMRALSEKHGGADSPPQLGRSIGIRGKS